MAKFRSIHRITTALVTGALALAALGCGDEDAEDQSAAGREDGALYVFVAQVEGTDSASTYVALTDAIPDDVLELDDALEIPGYGDAYPFDGKVYISDGESFEVTRYRVEGSELSPKTASASRTAASNGWASSTSSTASTRTPSTATSTP